MKSISKRGEMHKKLGVLCLLIALTSIIFTPIIGVGTVNAQEEDTIENALSSYGLEAPEVSISGNEVLIEYKRPLSEFSTLDEECVEIANILAIVSDELSNALVKIQQHYDNGDIMEITGKAEDGKAFLNDQISVETFSVRLEFKLLTRGPIVPGTCEPDKGENCENCEECACYPNEICDPDNPEANERGCVAQYAPNNSHLVGSEYVCDEGYEWNSNMTGCVPEKICPANAFEFQGECHCNPGYQWDSEGNECIPIPSDQDKEPDSISGGGLLEKFKGLMDSFITWIKSLFE